MTKQKLSCLVIASFCAVYLLPVHPAWGEEYTTTPIVLQAKDVLPVALLAGKNFKVDDTVQNDGLINVYQLTTDYGPTAAEGTAELQNRVAELMALATMEEMDRSEVFTESLVKGAKGTVQGAAALVTSPIETSKNVVKGAGQFFSNIGRAVVSSDPHQDNALKVALGYDAAKRAFAYEFGIDPYSSYEPAMDRLGEIARSAVAGGLTTKVAMASVDSTAVTVLRFTGTANSMRQLVRDNPPGKLREINKEKLLAMGVGEPLSEAFLGNYSYTPQEATLLVGELESMEGASGRDEFLAAANLAATPSVARFYRLTAQMMGGYHRNVAPIARIVKLDGRPMAQRKDGTLVLLAPIDRVFWTKDVAAKVVAFDRAIGESLPAGTNKEIWLTGDVDGTARSQLEAKGWKITGKADAVLAKEN